MDEKEIACMVCQSIRFYRKRALLSRQDVAGQVGKSVSWVVSLENGRITPTLPTLYALAQLFGCSVHDLIPDNRSPKVEANVTGNIASQSLQGEVLTALDERPQDAAYGKGGSNAL